MDNLEKQIDFMQKYLLFTDNSLELRDKLSKIDDQVEMDFDGSRLWKDFQIMRILGTNLDQDGSALLKVEEDLPPKTPCPFVLAVKCGRSLVFEVWAEKEKLLGNMSLQLAISSYLHVAFVFDLKYPQGAQTLGDILQRKVANYGDDSGTRTWRSLQAASKKYKQYLMVIGDLLSQ